MNATYIFLCGMVWAHFGEEDAGLELIRTLNSPDQNMRILARAMLEQANGGSKALIGQAVAQDEIPEDMATLSAFEGAQKSKLRGFPCDSWFSPASA
jgi:hypothetical protein